MRRGSAPLLAAIVLATFLVVPQAQAAVINDDDNGNNLYGTNRSDTINGNGGPDQIFAMKGNDRISGGSGNEALISTGPGRDHANGNENNERIFDDDGKLKRREKGDTLIGGNPDSDGDDQLYSADGERDRLDCGAHAGFGDVAVADVNDIVTNCETVFSFDGEQGFILGIPFTFRAGGKRSDTLVGTAFNEIIAGKNGNDVINAGPGFDILLAGLGKDRLFGEDDADVLVDEDGTRGDFLSGDGGADTIISADGARDTIDCGAGDGAGDIVFSDGLDVALNCELDIFFTPV